MHARRNGDAKSGQERRTPREVGASGSWPSGRREEKGHGRNATRAHGARDTSKGVVGESDGGWCIVNKEQTRAAFFPPVSKA